MSVPDAAPHRSATARSPWSAIAMLAAAALPPLLLYLRTLAPGLPAGDSGELIAVAWTGGVAHPPGYPLYAMLGGWWAHAFAFGNVAWRLDVLSALAMAAAAGV